METRKQSMGMLRVSSPGGTGWDNAVGCQLEDGCSSYLVSFTRCGAVRGRPHVSITLTVPVDDDWGDGCRMQRSADDHWTGSVHVRQTEGTGYDHSLGW